MLLPNLLNHDGDDRHRFLNLDGLMSDLQITVRIAYGLPTMPLAARCSSAPAACKGHPPSSDTDSVYPRDDVTTTRVQDEEQ
jgi:hypothetical protein